MPIQADIDELAALDADYTQRVASRVMPPIRQLEVIDATLHRSAGYVVCTLEGRRVLCIVPANIDLSAAVTGVARYVVWGIPLTGKSGSTWYFALGVAWNGVDGWRVPRMSGTVMSANTTITATIILGGVDELVLADATAGAITITLPPAANMPGKHFYIKKIDSSGNTVTIDGNGAETIDGAATKVLSTQYASHHIISSNGSWHIV